MARIGRARWRLGVVLTLGLLLGLLVVRAWLPPAEHASVAPVPAGATTDALPSSRAVARQAVDSTQRVEPGAFGQLPPLAMPGDLGARPIFAYEAPPDLHALPATADVHQVIWTDYTREMVGDLASRLGLGGQVEALGPGAFQVDVASQGRLFVAHGRITYNRPALPATLPLNGDRAIEQAHLWLAERSLLPADAGQPQIHLLPETGLALVTFAPIAPHALLTAEPGLTVTLDGGGVVREFASLWPARQQIARYPLSDPTAAWAAIQRGDGFVEMERGDVSIMPSLDGQPAGHIRLTGASLGYALAGEADAASAAYLQPVYIFQGMATLTGQTTPVACRVYLPALRDYPWPHG